MLKQFSITQHTFILNIDDSYICIYISKLGMNTLVVRFTLASWYSFFRPRFSFFERGLSLVCSSGAHDLRWREGNRSRFDKTREKSWLKNVVWWWGGNIRVNETIIKNVLHHSKCYRSPMSQHTLLETKILPLLNVFKIFFFFQKSNLIMRHMVGSGVGGEWTPKKTNFWFNQKWEKKALFHLNEDFFWFFLFIISQSNCDCGEWIVSNIKS